MEKKNYYLKPWLFFATIVSFNSEYVFFLCLIKMYIS